MNKDQCCNHDCNQGRSCPVRSGTHKPSEALHQLQEPSTEVQEAWRAGIDEGREQMAALSVTQAYEVVLPEPECWYDTNDVGEPEVEWNKLKPKYPGNWRPLYTDQQLRALLATGGQAQADCLTCNDHGAVGNILTAEPCPDCTVPAIKAQADARDAVIADLSAALDMFVGIDALHSLCEQEPMDAMGRVKGTWSKAAEVNARATIKAHRAAIAAAKGE